MMEVDLALLLVASFAFMIYGGYLMGRSQRRNVWGLLSLNVGVLGMAYTNWVVGGGAALAGFFIGAGATALFFSMMWLLWR